MVILKKVKGDTLIEAITATVIVGIVFVIALTAILNVEKLSNNHIKLKAYLLTEKIIQETKQNNRWFDEDYDFKNIKISKTVYSFEDNYTLKVVTFKAFRNKQILIERKMFIKMNGLTNNEINH